jgi:ribosomal protein L22
MAERQGGKDDPGDAGTKQDQPTETVAAEQAAAQAEEAKQEAAVDKAAEEKPKPKPRRKKAEPEAEGTAAAETGVDKDAAEAEKPKRSRGSRGSRGRTKAPAAEAEAAAGTAGEARGPKSEAKPRRAAAGTNGTAPVVRAHAKYVRTSARKARMVCDHIRGKSVDEARAILAYTPRAVARDWSKLLESAVANAEHNHELVGDDLKVLAAFADEGPTLKRFRPRAMGRATRIRKRTSHLTITLTPKEIQR